MKRLFCNIQNINKAVLLTVGKGIFLQTHTGISYYEQVIKYATRVNVTKGVTFSY